MRATTKRATAWQVVRLRRRIAVNQADSWFDEWQRIRAKVPRRSREDHPTFKAARNWAQTVKEIAPEWATFLELVA